MAAAAAIAALRGGRRGPRANSRRAESASSDAHVGLERDLAFHKTPRAQRLATRSSCSSTNPLQILLQDAYASAMRYAAFSDLTRREHRDILEAVKRGDAEAAAAASRRHLDRVRVSLAELLAPGE